VSDMSEVRIAPFSRIVARVIWQNEEANLGKCSERERPL
jgi:hypothetical protein